MSGKNGTFNIRKKDLRAASQETESAVFSDFDYSGSFGCFEPADDPFHRLSDRPGTGGSECFFPLGPSGSFGHFAG